MFNFRDLFPLWKRAAFAPEEAKREQTFKFEANDAADKADSAAMHKRSARTVPMLQGPQPSTCDQPTRQSGPAAIANIDKPGRMNTQTKKEDSEPQCAAAPTHSVARRSSPKKFQANRRNASLSTGPNTPRGKRISRQNAMKHGLFACEVVVREGDGKEAMEDFAELLARLKRDHNPVGCLEELQVETIAKAIWRLRRASRHEAGLILAETANVKVEARFAQSDQLCSYRIAPIYFQNEIRGSTLGVVALIGILAYAEEEIRSGGLATNSHDLLVTYFGTTPALTSYFEKVNANCDPSEDCKGDVLQWIASHRQSLEQIQPILKEKEDLEVEAKLARASMPLGAKRILRYEAKIHEQIKMAMEALAQLQKQRKESQSNGSGREETC